MSADPTGRRCSEEGQWCSPTQVFTFLLWAVFFQVIINSTITPNMTFTKTSQKFGQWADSRANTVFGLGFSSEQQLTKVRSPLHCVVAPCWVPSWNGVVLGEQCSLSAAVSLSGITGLPGQVPFHNTRFLGAAGLGREIHL